MVDMTKPIGKMDDEEFTEMQEAIKNAKYTKEVLPEKGMFGVFLVMVVQEKEFSKRRLSPLFKNVYGAKEWLKIHDKRVSKHKGEKNG